MGMKTFTTVRMFIAYGCAIALYPGNNCCNLCVVFAVFYQLHQDHFHESPGRALIWHEKFAFTNGSGNIIRKSVWGRHIQPGSKVDMSVVIWRSNLSAEDCRPKCRSQIQPHSRTRYGYKRVLINTGIHFLLHKCKTSSVQRAEMAPHGPDSPEVLTDESQAEVTQADVNRLPKVRLGNILGLCRGRWVGRLCSDRNPRRESS
jgi:hypothetical protein